MHNRCPPRLSVGIVLSPAKPHNEQKKIDAHGMLCNQLSLSYCIFIFSSRVLTLVLLPPQAWELLNGMKRKRNLEYHKGVLPAWTTRSYQWHAFFWQLSWKMVNIIRLLSIWKKKKKTWRSRYRLYWLYITVNEKWQCNTKSTKKKKGTITSTTSVKRTMKETTKTLTVTYSSVMNSITALWDTVGFCSVQKQKTNVQTENQQFLIQ